MTDPFTKPLMVRFLGLFLSGTIQPATRNSRAWPRGARVQYKNSGYRSSTDSRAHRIRSVHLRPEGRWLSEDNR